jgi:hypothetical protein
MQGFSWPVAVLALVTMLAGAVVGDALRAAAGGAATDTLTIANTTP